MEQIYLNNYINMPVCHQVVYPIKDRFKTPTWNVWVTLQWSNSISKTSNWVEQSRYASWVASPYAWCFDWLNIWCVWWTDYISKIKPDWTNTSYTLSFWWSPSCYWIAYDWDNMWVCNSAGTSIAKVNKSWNSTVYNTTKSNPVKIAFDWVNMWVTYYGSSFVSKVSPSWTFTHYATPAYIYWICFDWTSMWAWWSAWWLYKINISTWWVTTYTTTWVTWGIEWICYDWTYIYWISFDNWKMFKADKNWNIVATNTTSIWYWFKEIIQYRWIYI